MRNGQSHRPRSGAPEPLLLGERRTLVSEHSWHETFTRNLASRRDIAARTLSRAREPAGRAEAASLLEHLKSYKVIWVAARARLQKSHHMAHGKIGIIHICIYTYIYTYRHTNPGLNSKSPEHQLTHPLTHLLCKTIPLPGRPPR